MKKYLKNLVLILLVAIAATACNKEDLNAEKAMHIVVGGYNGGTNALQMSIDTTEYGGAAQFKPASMINNNVVYSYRAGKKPMFTLTDIITKKVVYSRELPANGTKAVFNYIFLDGKELDINAPAADPSTNKLGFYILYNTSNDPFDIFLYRKDNTTGQEFRTYLAKNVTPGKWVYLDYAVPADFGTKPIINSNASLCFTKAGTTDQWAFDNEQNKSSVPAQSLFLPVEDEKGLVQPYFFTPLPYGQGLSKLFFYPERQ
jgi:hypothetical protein